MMYELGIVTKYLIPRWKQLSVSIISLVSVLVIAAVVWLIVVFFSVTNGLQSSWVDKLIALTAPVRVTPTQHYYHSYYYLVDGISASSDYNLKTIGEKQQAPHTLSYDANYDEEAPANWPQPDIDQHGELIDPVKKAFALMHTINGVSAIDYEMTAANLRLNLVRSSNNPFGQAPVQSTLTQSSYLGSLDPDNSKLLETITSPSAADLTNLLNVLAFDFNGSDDTSKKLRLENEDIVRGRLHAFFDDVTIKELRTPPAGWLIPASLYPAKATWEATLVSMNNSPQRLIVAKQPSSQTETFEIKNMTYEPVKLIINHGLLTVFRLDDSEIVSAGRLPLFLKEGAIIGAKLIPDSIEKTSQAADLLFELNLTIQGTQLNGIAAYSNLQIEKALTKSIAHKTSVTPSFWMYTHDKELTLPSIEGMGEGILLPKTFRASGVLLGDTGSLSYYAPTISSVHEQQLPIFVAGFYDPGIIPIGGKYIITSKEITTLIRSFYNQEEIPVSNGINVRFDNSSDADFVKMQLQKAFDDSGIGPYWKIETYKEYEFTKDIIQQLQSEKRLFTLLAMLIILVACSNIISMLIILVNDKKLEIGILRSMGATSFSIALIFGLCGVVMGTVGSMIGMFVALITLQNIQKLVDLIGRIQGYEMFNPLFYGETLPSSVSLEALSFVLIATASISLIAGIIPAIKASLLKPASILKAE